MPSPTPREPVHGTSGPTAAASDAATDLDATGDTSGVRPAGVASRHVYLVVNEARGTTVVRLEDGHEATVGRAHDCAIVLDDSRVSRRHAVFRRAAERVWVRDLGSRNGTRTNGRVVRGGERSVGGGDVVRIGSAEVVVAVASGDRWHAETAGPGPDGGVVVEGGEAATRGASGETRGQEPSAVEGSARGVVVGDPAMRQVFLVARRLARALATVLLVGETGVGKEVVAEHIHRGSPRAHGPFVRLNCASLPASLLDSELFGHEKGAFTGAIRRKVGWIEAADGGTLLLDEVGELPPEAQVRLLRVLETRHIARLGGEADIAVDVRFVCATHRDLEAEVTAGRFRQDLYYRVSAFTIRVPPLRERPSEIAPLADLFARDMARRAGRPEPVLAPDAVAALLRHRWPGNVRELRNAIEHALVLAEGGEIRAAHLPAAVRGDGGAETSGAGVLRGELEDVERSRIAEALRLEGGNQTRAAARLGISRRGIIYKMAKYGLRR